FFSRRFALALKSSAAIRLLATDTGYCLLFYDDRKRDSRNLFKILREAGPSPRALKPPSARKRPDASVRQCGHEPVQGRIPRHGEARLHARNDFAEVPARGRHAQRPRR